MIKENLWISTKENLPPDDGWVLVWCGNHPKPQGIYMARKGYTTDTYFTMQLNRLLLPDEVTHWMPIPELPNYDRPLEKMVIPQEFDNLIKSLEI